MNLKIVEQSVLNFLIQNEQKVLDTKNPVMLYNDWVRESKKERFDEESCKWAFQLIKSITELTVENSLLLEVCNLYYLEEKKDGR